MKFKFKIRQANTNDAVGITAIGYSSWLDSYSNIIDKDIIHSIDFQNQVNKCGELIKRGQQILVASDEDGFILGYCSFGPSKDALHILENEIYSIYISKKMRDVGLGGMLLYDAEKTMTYTRPISARLFRDNVSGRRFFEDNGYTYLPGRDGMFNGIAQDLAYIKKVW